MALKSPVLPVTSGIPSRRFDGGGSKIVGRKELP
jgi:hypothetical protein